MDNTCDGCKEQLKGPYYTVDERRLCAKCFEEKECPTCLHCKKKITGEYLLAFDANYHKDCFKCSNCKAVITASYFQKNGAMVCPACNEKMDVACIRCKQKGGSPMITVGSFAIPFHLSCFKCDGCKKEIDPQKEEFTPQKNEIFHMDCYRKKLETIAAKTKPKA